MQKISVWKMSGLLLLSGLCALVYQIVWLRELRLVFGGSTAATGMVLAVFMGGLGAGAFYLGRVADRSRNPLALYGYLELGIAFFAALSPLLILLSRNFYISLGGSLALGLPIATLVRILLSAVILLVPTFLMGGTLPAAIRAVETVGDRGRRSLGLLYGFNTLGGVAGVLLATFLLLELLGNRFSLWGGCLVNTLLAGMVLFMARRITVGDDGDPGAEVPGAIENEPVMPQTQIFFVSGAAFVSGFTFLLMELVWYRMLAPIMGGSTYTFSLILAMALAGIALGGWIFGALKRKTRTTLVAFAVVCGLEALFIAIPFALGDRLAVYTAMVKSQAVGDFSTQFIGWIRIVATVVLPASIMAGIQFPMLINLLGEGKRDVGFHTGFVYGWNTVGAIIGSLGGGFGLIPLLTAPGCWQLVVVLLCLLAAVSLLVCLILKNRSLRLLIPVPLLVVALFFIFGEGPSQTWRHSGIGSGQQLTFHEMSPNELREWSRKYRREVIWEEEGVESSIALHAYDSLSFIVNGKSDGNATLDAATQVMGPMIGAILHPEPKKSMVIGLGTGSSAGWLAEIPTMEKVDVLELEPAVLEVAKRCAPVNFNVLEHPKVEVIIGDGREIVQTIDELYDVIFSEPSNPYRAGIASLYTREFYQAVSQRLTPGGYFSQWVQAYYVDEQTVRTIIATLASVFESVEIWISDDSDLIFVCSMEERTYSRDQIRLKVEMEPYRFALYRAWGVYGVEGFLGAYLGNSSASRKIAEEEVKKGNINTDDRMLAEFGFARTAGRTGLFSLEGLRDSLRNEQNHRPDLEVTNIDWPLIDENFFRIMLWGGKTLKSEIGYTPRQLERWRVHQAFIDGDYQTTLNAIQRGLFDQGSLLDIATVAESLAQLGDPQAVELAARIKAYWPATGDGIMATYLVRQGELDRAYGLLVDALKGFRESPWQVRSVMIHILSLAMEMAYNDFHTQEIFDLLKEPFSVYNLEEYRKFILVQIGKTIDCSHGAEALGQWEPIVPWREKLLDYRASCYKEINSPLARRAEKELEEFRKANESVGLVRPEQ